MQLDTDARAGTADAAVTVADDATPVRSRHTLALSIHCITLPMTVVAVQRAAPVHCAGADGTEPDAEPIATTILRKRHRNVLRRHPASLRARWRRGSSVAMQLATRSRAS